LAGNAIDTLNPYPGQAAYRHGKQTFAADVDRQPVPRIGSLRPHLAIWYRSSVFDGKRKQVLRSAMSSDVSAGLCPQSSYRHLWLPE
jgi:hypothetical protein